MTIRRNAHAFMRMLYIHENNNDSNNKITTFINVWMLYLLRFVLVLVLSIHIITIVCSKFHSPSLEFVPSFWICTRHTYMYARNHNFSIISQNSWQNLNDYDNCDKFKCDLWNENLYLVEFCWLNFTL